MTMIGQFGLLAAARSFDRALASNALILRGQGATVVDSSIAARAVTVFGNAQTSNEAYVFGQSSIKFDGTGDYLTVAHNAAFNGSGNFTVDALISPGSVSRVNAIATKRPPGAATAWFLFINDFGKVALVAWDATATLVINIASTTSLVVGGKYHVAATRENATAKWRLFVNGTREAEGVESGAIATNAEPLHVGRDPTILARDFLGYMHLRVTPGITRWTEDFTPPTDFPSAV